MQILASMIVRVALLESSWRLFEAKSGTLLNVYYLNHAILNIIHAILGRLYFEICFTMFSFFKG